VLALIGATLIVVMLYWLVRGDRSSEIVAPPPSLKPAGAKTAPQKAQEKPGEAPEPAAPANQSKSASERTSATAPAAAPKHDDKAPPAVATASDREITVRLFGPDGKPLGEWCRANLEAGNAASIEVMQTKSAPAAHLSLTKVARIGSVHESSVAQGEWPSEVKLTTSPPFPLYVSACFAPQAHDAEHLDVIKADRVESAHSVVNFTIPLEVFKPPKSTVKLCLVDATSGAPIEAARIGLSVAGTFTADADKLVSGSDGCVRAESLRQGPYSLTISANAHEWVQENVTVGPDANTDLGTYRLAPSTTISGHLTDEHGPVTGVNVFAYPLKRFEKPFRVTSSFASTAGNEGAFSISDLGRQKYVVRGQAPDRAPIPIVVDTTAGDMSNIAVRLTRGTEVKFILDVPREEGALCITDAQKLPIAERELDMLPMLTQRLAPGKYEWRIDVDGETLEKHDLEVAGKDFEVHVGH
jgi:hypothetical protein